MNKEFQSIKSSWNSLSLQMGKNKNNHDNMRLIGPIWSNRRGQEEAVGFVLIIIIVAIVFLVMLSLFLRQGNESYEEESREVYYYLDSLMETTTECILSYEPNFKKTEESIELCYRGFECLSGEDVCEVVREHVDKNLKSAFNTGEGSALKGYEFYSYYDNNSTKEEILNLSSGDCVGGFRGAEYVSPAFPGNIISRLNLCY